MTNRTQSKVAHPWEAPGYRFSIGWPTGYVCVVAGPTAAARSGAVSAQQTLRREEARQRGVEWAKGLPPLSKPAKKAAPKNAPRKKAPPAAKKEPREPAPASCRHIAIVAGASRYRTGKPCLRGHLSDRYTGTGTCVECDVAAKAARIAATGKQTYSTGRPCARGHISDRRANGTCIACERSRNVDAWDALREEKAAA